MGDLAATLSHELQLPDAAPQIEGAEIELASFQSLIDTTVPERLMP